MSATLFVLGTWTDGARADESRAGLTMKAATEEAPRSFYGSLAPAQVFVFGTAPAPRLILFPGIQVIRPADIPTPKPTKGLGLAFDW